LFNPSAPDRNGWRMFAFHEYQSGFAGMSAMPSVTHGAILDSLIKKRASGRLREAPSDVSSCPPCSSVEKSSFDLINQNRYEHDRFRSVSAHSTRR
jgi:hypothetical protein